MASTPGMRGTWTGRMVDLQGFEGEITLRLERGEKSGTVMGWFDVAIGGHHDSIRRRGTVEGRQTDDRIVLNLEVGDEKAARIAVDGRVWALNSGGTGLCATYDVAAKSFSPLRGGVLALSTGVPIRSTTVEGTKPPGPADAPKVRRARRKRAARRRSS